MAFDMDLQLRRAAKYDEGERLAARAAIKSEFLRLENAAKVALAREQAAIAALDNEVQRSVLSEAEETRLRAQLTAARFEAESRICPAPKPADLETEAR